MLPKNLCEIAVPLEYSRLLHKMIGPDSPRFWPYLSRCLESYSIDSTQWDELRNFIRSASALLEQRDSQFLRVHQVRLALDELKKRASQLEEVFGFEGIEEWQPNEFSEPEFEGVLSALEETNSAVSELTHYLSRPEPVLWQMKAAKRNPEAALAQRVECGVRTLMDFRKPKKSVPVRLCPPGAAEGAVFQRVQFALPGARTVPPDPDEVDGGGVSEIEWST